MFDVVKTEAVPANLPIQEPADIVCFEIQKRPGDNMASVEELVQYAQETLGDLSRCSGGSRRRSSSGCGARSCTPRSIHRRNGNKP